MKKSLALISVLAIAAISPANPYLLRVNAKPGQTFRYNLVMRSSMMRVQTGMTMKAINVQNKLTTFHTTIGSLTVDGKPAPGSERLKSILMITVLDGLGNIVKSEVKGMPKDQAATNQTAVPFPVKAVKLGDKWTAVGVVQNKKVNTTYTLKEIKTVNGMKAAVIHAVPDSMAQVKPNGPIVFSVELATGMPISMKMSGQAVQVDGTKLNIEVTMNRG
jgi:hypothetical protein